MDRKIVVLTPVRNEKWVLDCFLLAASQFADHIIILDQMSVDGSREIARRYEKVILIDNPSEDFNERERQEMLLREARKLGENNVLIALDADEIPSPTFLDESFLNQLKLSEIGTVFQLDWLNLEPDLKTAYRSPMAPLIFVDDGSPNTHNVEMHRTRVPVPLGNKVLHLSDPAILHLQYVNEARMRNKHIWYQVLEKAKDPAKSSLLIYRTYHHMDSRSPKNLETLDVKDAWRDRGVLLERLKSSSNDNPWEQQVEYLLASKPAHVFKDIERSSKSNWGSQTPLLRYARFTQRYVGRSKFNPLRLAVRVADVFLTRVFHK